MLCGIYFYSSVQGTNTITQNTIYVSPTGDGSESRRDTYGIELHGGSNTTVSHNRITLTGMAANYAGGRWYGIYIYLYAWASGTFTLANNQVTISPTNSVTQTIYGIWDDRRSSDATLNAYHNSVYIGGTATDVATWAYLRTSGATGATTLKNNIFFNGRSGGSVNHFAAGNQSASGSFTSDYNLFAGTGTTAASFMDWGTSESGTPVDFATWQSSSGGDSHSYADVAANIPAASLFTDPANGDLHIKPGSGSGPLSLVSNLGTPIAGITDDYDGEPRSPTAPDIGADEFTALDLAITKSVAPTTPVNPGDTITYTLTFSNTGFATVTKVVITDTIPVSVTHSSLSVTNSGAAITATGSVSYVWDMADLAFGEGGIITITGQLSATLATCTFTNTAVITATMQDENPGNNSSDAGVTVSAGGTIVIEKVTDPAGGTGFQFTNDVPGGPTPFNLNHGGSRTFNDVDAGAYTVTETDPTPGGYVLTNLDCVESGTNNSFGTLGTRAATINLEAGETVTCTFTNEADTDSDGAPDGLEGAGDRDGDGIPDYLDYDPTGYFYDETTGQIIPGGQVSVTGPGVVTIVHDGSSGFYQFTTDATAGTYPIQVTLPPGYGWSSTCLRQDPPPLDPTGGPNPTVLGNGEYGDTGFLVSNACTDYYLSFYLAAGDPIIFNNNLPLRKLFSLTVNVTGTGSGRVTSDPAGIDCGGDCTENYGQGTVVTLTAHPGAKSYLANWSGDCVGAGLTTQVTMDADETCTATFWLSYWWHRRAGEQARAVGPSTRLRTSPVDGTGGAGCGRAAAVAAEAEVIARPRRSFRLTIDISSKERYNSGCPLTKVEGGRCDENHNYSRNPARHSA